MKKSAGLLATLFLALPLMARPSLTARMRSLTVTNPETHSVPADVAATVYAQWRAYVAAKHTAATGGAVHTSAVADSRSSRVIVMWWPAGSSNTLATTGANVITLTLQPNTFNTYPDFVANTLHQSGLGSIVVIPSASGTLTFDAGIDGFSRIYTKQPGSNGTVSQEFPGVDPDSSAMFDEGVSLGLRQDANYRTNWGIVNTDTVSHSFHITFMGENNQTATVDVTVPAFGMIQQAAPAGTFGALNVVFTSPDITSFGSFIAYASSTDNTTGDGWVSLAAGDLSSNDLSSIGL